MKEIRFVLDTSLLSFVLPGLLRIGTEPVVRVSRAPEAYLGEKSLLTFDTPEKRYGDIETFLSRLKEASPESVFLL